MRDYILEQIELVESWLAGDETDWQQHADDCKSILDQIEQRALRDGYPGVVAATQDRGAGIKHTRQVLAACLAAIPAPEKETFSPPEIAGMLRVSDDTVLKWIRNRELIASNLAAMNSTRPRYSIQRADLQAFLKLRQLNPLPDRSTRARRDPDVIEYF